MSSAVMVTFRENDEIPEDLKNSNPNSMDMNTKDQYNILNDNGNDLKPTRENNVLNEYYDGKFSVDKIENCKAGLSIGGKIMGRNTIEFSYENIVDNNDEEELEMTEVEYLYREATKNLMTNDRAINIISGNPSVVRSINILLNNKPLVGSTGRPNISTRLSKKYEDFRIRLGQMNVALSYLAKSSTKENNESVKNGESDKRKDETSSEEIDQLSNNGNKQGSEKFKPTEPKTITVVPIELVDRIYENTTNAPTLQSNSDESMNRDTKTICAARTEGVNKYFSCSIDEIRKAQEDDPECKKIREEIGESLIISWDQQGIKLYLNTDNLIYARGNIQLAKGDSTLIDVVYIPKILRSHIIGMEHGSRWASHPQYLQLCKAILAHYFWPTFRSDVRKFTESCDLCQRVREKRKKSPILDFDKPNSPWELVAIDIIGPLYKSADGSEYILSIVDVFTRFVTLIPLTNQTKETILEALETKYISRFGCPRVLLSDNASNFCSSLFEEVCSILGIVHRRTPPWHPQGNGTLERSNREVKKKLTFLCSNTSQTWDRKLHLAEFAINNAYNSSIGTSPCELLYGKRMRSPTANLDLLEEGTYILTSPYLESFRDRLEIIRKAAVVWESNVRGKRNLYKNSKRKLINYDIGDSVLYKRVKPRGTRKEGFSFSYGGPYVVLDKISDVTYKLGNPTEESERIVTAHADRIKNYIDPNPSKLPSRLEEDSQKKDKNTSQEDTLRVQKDSPTLEDTLGSDIREVIGESRRSIDERVVEVQETFEEHQSPMVIDDDIGVDIRAISTEEKELETDQLNIEDTLEASESLMEGETVEIGSGNETADSHLPQSEEKQNPKDKGKSNQGRNKPSGKEVINHQYQTRSKGKIEEIRYEDYKFDRAGNIKIVRKDEEK